MVMKYNLGSGPTKLPGFVNIDMICGDIKHDLLYGLPPQCKDADMFTSCHFFEHLTADQSIKLIKECYEYLKPGGVFRLVVPDFRLLVTKYLENDWQHWDLIDISRISRLETISIIDIVSDGVYQPDPELRNTHKSIWDLHKALKVLEYAGFGQCKQVPYDFNIDPPTELRRRYSIVIQGIK